MFQSFAHIVVVFDGFPLSFVQISNDLKVA